jgi:serine/threonine protein kinase
MLTTEGTIKILDLGLARFVKDPQSITSRYEDGAILGTADFISPEQILRGEPVDQRADLYALGGTFYFLLAGQPPFPDRTVTQKLLDHQLHQPRPLRELRSDVPPGLEAVLQNLLAKRPSDRYASAPELAAALGPWIGASARDSDHRLPAPIVVPEAGTVALKPRRVQRRRWPWIAAGVGLLLIVLITLLVMLRWTTGLPADG